MRAPALHHRTAVRTRRWWWCWVAPLWATLAAVPGLAPADEGTGGGSGQPAPAAAASTVVYLLRHAERLDDSEDSPLSPAGTARAAALVHVVPAGDIRAILSTPYPRTRDTVRPLSEASGVSIQEAPKADMPALLQRLVAEDTGGAIVVVGHADNIPDLLAALGVTDPAALGSVDYGDLFVVEVGPEGLRDWHRQRFGDGGGAFLWRVEPPPDAPGTAAGTGGGAPVAPSYLLGTMHLGVGPDEIPDFVWTALHAAHTVMLEADLRQVDPVTMLADVVLPAGQSLSQFFTPEVWAELVSRTSGLLPEAMLERYRPWLVQSLIVETMLPVTQPLDMRVLTDAAAAGQELAFLETWQQQVALMNGAASDYFVSELTDYANDPDQALSEARALVDAYHSGSEAAVMAVMFDPEDVSRYPDFYEQLLYARTRSWLPTVEAQIQRGGAFVAVGLGHLVGDRGLAALLTAAGYRVSRVVD